MGNDTAEYMATTPNITSDEKTITELAKSYTMYKIRLIIFVTLLFIPVYVIYWI